MNGSTRRFWVIEATAKNCVAEFYVNDVPVTRRGREHGLFHGAPINELLHPGENELSMLVLPGATPGTAVAGDGDGRRRRVIPEEGSVEVRLCAYPQGAVIGGPDGEELLALRWEADGETPVIVPFVLTGVVTLDVPFGPWEWESFPRTSLDDAAAAAIRALVADIHLSLSGALADPFLEACAPRFRDIEQAHYMAPGDRARAGANLLPSLFERSDWEMEALEGIDFDLRVVGRGRLVELVDEAGAAILRKPSGEGGMGTEFKALVGFDGAGWKIVR